MSDKNMLSLRERLEQLSTAELDAMMQAELRKELPDANAVKLILGILEGWEKDISVEMDTQTEAAWGNYQKRMAQKVVRSKRNRRWIRVCATVSAAVLAVALFVVVPQRAEALEFLKEVLSGWRNDILEFFSSEESVSEVEHVFETNHPSMQMIYDTAVEMGVKDPLIPMWFENGFEVTVLETVSTPAKSKAHCVLTAVGRKSIFDIDVNSSEVVHGYYGESDIYKSFEREGTTYEVTLNHDKWVAIWRKDNVEYSLTLGCQEETLNKILSSIYVMED